MAGPPCADFVFDARALLNPNYDEQLRPLTRLDQPVADFLNARPEVCLFIDDIERFLRTWLPRFRADHRSYLTVAIGSTGGWHRSVYIAQALGRRLANNAEVLVRHREIEVLDGYP
ncbi:MAG: P-loop ATPase protein family protein [Glomeribacter sp. 1016415]|nr:P-loop ATPase protein family protein [Glomeribacter sp. 1016415]